MAEITPKEFVDMPLSAATRQVIYDMKQLMRQGIVPNMADWAVTDIHDKVCSVCLGAAACVSFEGITAISYPGGKVAGISLNEWDKIPYTFNEIRRCYYTLAIGRWYGTEQHYPFGEELDKGLTRLISKHTGMFGRLDKNQLNKLYRQMNEFANLLEKHGR